MTLIFNNGSINGSGGGGSGDSYTKAETNALLSVKASTSLDNLNADGQMVIDSQNGTISNCILEIPQNIKLTLENNVLTLKSGSVVTNTGTTYSTTTTTQDYSTTFSADGKYYVVFTGYSLVNWVNFGSVSSGSALPETVILNTRFFNVTDKQWYYADAIHTGWTLASTWRYPLAIIEVSNGVASFVKDSNGNDMIFNGAGFIGHHAFVYPNIRKLSPDGFSSNGNLSSVGGSSLSLSIIEMTNSENSVYFNPNGTIARGYISYWDSLAVAPQNSWKKIYVRDINKSGIYYNNVFTEVSVCAIAIYTYDGTTVTDFTIRQPYEGARDLLTDSLQANVTTLTGYDSTQTQTLKNINGVLQWVTD